MRFRLMTVIGVMACLSPCIAHDEADIRSVVEKFFAAYPQKDLDGFMRLWSETSPDAAARRAVMQRAFATDDYRLITPTVERVKVEGERATLRARVEATTTHRRTQQQTQQLWMRNFVLVKEGGQWKVWREVAAAADFATALMDAKTEEARKALLTAEKELLTPELPQALITRGRDFWKQGKYADTFAAFQLARDMAEQIGDKAGMVHALGATASLHTRIGNNALGMEISQKGLALAEMNGDAAGIAYMLNNIGAIYHLQGNFTAALQSFRRALTLAEGVKAQEWIAYSLIGIGLAEAEQGRYAPGLAAFQQSLALCKELDDAPGIARAAGLVAYVLKLQGNYSEAMKFYEEKRKLCEVMGDREGLAHVMNGVAETHCFMGNPSLGVEIFQKALAEFEAMKNKREPAIILGRLGAAYLQLGNHAQALDSLMQSHARFEELGYLWWDTVTLANIGLVHYTRNDHPRAQEFYQKALTLAEGMGALDAIRNCYLGLGHVYRAQGKKDEAVATYQKAIDALESVRARVAGGEAAQLKFLHAEGKDDAYQSLVSLLMEQGKTADALRLLERARSKQLLDSLRLRSLTVRDANLHSLLTKTEDLEQTLAAQEQERVAELSKPAAQQDRTRVANLTQLVAQTRADLLKVANALRAANPDYERFITIKITDLRNVQARLPEDVVVVQYLPLETALTIFVVTRGKMQARSVAVSRKRMDELVATFHDDVRRVQESGGRRGQNWDWQSERAQRLRGALTALYGYLIGSVQADIAHARTVIVVPSGTLYYLPFQALARENADRSLTFLAEEKELTVLTSLDLWLQITNEDSAGDAPTPRVCALGNPDGTLPAAEQEVKRIGALFDRSLIYTGADVTRVRLESLPKDVTIAHFATHGQLSEQDINECNLVLANGDKLKLGEVYGLAGKYSARMTVLSACETAVGRKDPGNEVAHLANGFVEAGSTSIIASLWKVSDASTAALMEQFYHELKNGKRKAEAKRLAEVSLLKDKATAHPYFWAPFVLIGDWR